MSTPLDWTWLHAFLFTFVVLLVGVGGGFLVGVAHG